MLFKDFIKVLQRYIDNDIVSDADAYALRAASQTERSAELDLVLQIMLRNGFPEQINDLRRSLQMAGAADADIDVEHLK